MVSNIASSVRFAASAALSSRTTSFRAGRTSEIPRARLMSSSAAKCPADGRHGLGDAAGVQDVAVEVDAAGPVVAPVELPVVPLDFYGESVVVDDDGVPQPVAAGAVFRWSLLVSVTPVLVGK